MNNMWSVVALTACAMTAGAQSVYEGRPATILETSAAKLVIDLGGGSIVDFHMSNDGLNPLRWLGPGHEKLTMRPMAHFLCLDRWGQPSTAEERNGMPYHGEATRVMWREEPTPAARERFAHAEFSAMLPIAGLEVRRTVRLARNAAYFTVSETVTNRNKLGRLYNMVQHPTIGPPFLDETTVVDANAGKGLMQSSSMPNPEEPPVFWPGALKDGQQVDLRRLTSDPIPAVVSFVVDAEYGWVTAVTPSKGLLLGYLWKSSEYPWLNIWRHVDSGKPLARGLEFGTTGLHQPFGILVAKGSIFGRRLLAYLDAGESATRSYAAFLLETPHDFAGVESVAYAQGRIVVRERKQPARELAIETGELF
ncbi:MAG: hypothetical protein WD696_17080 [Bryobacteraceae bacterium]